ncbi:MAG: TetR/AcrR family transcriptional regulator [Parvibaculum sp.]|nr:TetR/AcrR family transcriptional regulator [Parvibaculum sp.]MBO6679707.1 TetR/AcrR family transcriptional regulator [Parvibaculum sp.]MBO6684684.1 TetR/AcrR family transcriptional regulator [Parvibaculum sp.]MBO6905557.1 TetR/AcrR family transcriptional regulator [Parvibaculum sp.]
MPKARANQKRRTRKDLLQAAARLMKEGRTPSLEEIAEEALVSRATAYRYFPNVEALLIEAPLDLALPDEEQMFRGSPAADPVARMERVDKAFHDMILDNETPLRLMLAKTMERRAAGDDGLPARQNRRTPMIEAALAPARAEFTRASLDRLQKALALVVGTEAMIVFKDVLQLDEKEAREVKRWAIRALIEAARK